MIDTSKHELDNIGMSDIWNIESLKEYIDRRFEDSDKAVQAALQAAKEAVGKAEVATEKRFDAVNEFRQQLSDQTNTFIPRLEYDAQHKNLDDKLAALTDRINTNQGAIQGSTATKNQLYTAASLAAAAAGAIATIAIILVGHK